MKDCGQTPVQCVMQAQHIKTDKSHGVCKKKKSNKLVSIEVSKYTAQRIFRNPTLSASPNVPQDAIRGGGTRAPKIGKRKRSQNPNKTTQSSQNGRVMTAENQ